MPPLCPGPDRAAECENFACRHSGCQGRPAWPRVAELLPLREDHGAAEAARYGIARSPHWPAVERAFRAAHPHCLACPPGTPEHAVQVHHRAPFHYVIAVGRADLELDPRNLVSLCEAEHGKPAEDHHLLIGHLGNFKAGNLEVLEDAATTFHGMSAAAIQADPRWRAEEKTGRLKPLDEMSDADKAAFRAMLDARFPIMLVKQGRIGTVRIAPAPKGTGAGACHRPEPRGEASHDRHRPLDGRPVIAAGDGKEQHRLPMLSSHDGPGPRLGPVFAYIGGKRNLAPAIVETIGAVPHELYAEPFVGAGGVFLRRPAPAAVEVINDLSRDVATFFRVLQRHYQALLDVLRWQLTTRADFERLIATDPATLTDLERSARFLYLQRLSFGGKVRGRTFGVSRTAPARFDLHRLIPALEEVHERLTRVVIECLPYREFIARYDGERTLFYLDPPYIGSETDYGREVFGPDDFARLAEQLRGIKGAFLLSINDVPLAREVFAGFDLRELATTYVIREGDGLPVRELLICGPRPFARLRRPVQLGSLF